MERFGRILKKIFFLPPSATALIALPSFVLVFFVLGAGIDGVIAYVSYGLSAYGLIISATGFTRVVQAVRRGVDNNPLVKKLLAHPFGGRYLTDAAFRAEASLYIGFCINLLYAAVKMISGILYGSVWFITLSVYYILLAVMRFLLLGSVRKKHKGGKPAHELRRCRICGVLLALMTLALSGMVLFIVRRDGEYNYPGVFIYVVAIYAFYAVIAAALNIVKFRKNRSSILSAAKAINLTAALVSMFALEAAMLSQFGSGDDHSFRRIMTAVSGGVICALVLGMAIYMIVYASKRLRQNKGNTAQLPPFGLC